MAVYRILNPYTIKHFFMGQISPHLVDINSPFITQPIYTGLMLISEYSNLWYDLLQYGSPYGQ